MWQYFLLTFRTYHRQISHPVLTTRTYISFLRSFDAHRFLVTAVSGSKQLLKPLLLLNRLAARGGEQSPTLVAPVPYNGAGGDGLRQGCRVGAFAERAPSGLGVHEPTVAPASVELDREEPLIGLGCFSCLLHAQPPEPPSAALAEEPHHFAPEVRGNAQSDLPAVAVRAVRGLRTQPDLLRCCPLLNASAIDARTNGRESDALPKGLAFRVLGVATSGRVGPSSRRAPERHTLATVRRRSNQGEP
jgi:hypothetical protein